MTRSNSVSALAPSTVATGVQAPALVQYPAGSMVRVRQICGSPDRPGILPIHPRTWTKMVAAGRAPRGVLLGPRTRAWTIESILAYREQLLQGLEQQAA
jgi:hypothetical protein